MSQSSQMLDESNVHVVVEALSVLLSATPAAGGGQAKQTVVLRYLMHFYAYLLLSFALQSVLLACVAIIYGHL